MKKYDVSALICTYNPDLDKLLMTVKSFLLQEKIKIQIVITDDGSEDDYFMKIEEIFKKENFTDYKFVKNKKNNGTVLNICSGLKVCDGEYIKVLSPGDYIYSENSLYNWLVFMKSGNYVMSGSDYICYGVDENKEEHTLVQKAHPQLTNLEGKRLKYNYLLNNDIFLGAAILVKKDALCKYIELIKGKVKYAEDNYLRIMVYCNEKVSFYPCTTIMYEVGTGVSTSGKEKWQKLLQADWEMTDSIIENIDILDKKFKYDFSKIAKLSKDTGKVKLFQKYIRYISIKGLILTKMRIKIKPRFTTNCLPVEWLKKIKQKSYN
ncbi:MAG: glycosyltransferase [Clostridiales bacterium]|nr:glycosyltransferase [Clostridiales bacterium]